MDGRKLALSRRQLLGGLGAVGAASAGAGLGTTALFSDEESFENNAVTAGELDLSYEVDTTYSGPGNTGDIVSSDPVDGGTSSVYTLTDVKPGDTGSITLKNFQIDTNPAYLWLCGELTTSIENDNPEPETNTDTGDGGELVEVIQASVKDGNGTEILSGSLREVLAALQSGLALNPDGGHTLDSGTVDDYSSSGNPSAGNATLDWELPTSVGNAVQGDRLAFDLLVYAQQARYNDGTDNPCVDATYDAVADFDDNSLGITAGNAYGWGDTWNQSTIDTLSNLGAIDSNETLDISYGSEQVVFQVDLANSFDTSSNDNDVFNLVFDADGDGTLDFEVAWAADPGNTPPAGENFWHKDLGSGTATSLDDFDDITADLDTNGNTVTISVGRDRLATSGNTYKVAWQALYRDGGASPAFDAVKIPFTIPRWKYNTGSTNFATETLQ